MAVFPPNPQVEFQPNPQLEFIAVCCVTTVQYAVRSAHMSRSCFCRALSLRGRRVWVLHGDQLIVYFLYSFLYFIINRNPITQKPYSGYHSTDRSMRGRRVWVLHGDQLIVYFLYSFLYFIINRNPITQKPYSGYHSIDRSLQLAFGCYPLVSGQA